MILLCSITGLTPIVFLIMTLFRRTALPPPKGQSETKEIKIMHGEESDECSDGEDEDEDDDGAAGWESFIDEVILFPGADGGVY